MILEGNHTRAQHPVSSHALQVVHFLLRPHVDDLAVVQLLETRFEAVILGDVFLAAFVLDYLGLVNLREGWRMRVCVRVYVCVFVCGCNMLTTTVVTSHLLPCVVTGA